MSKPVFEIRSVDPRGPEASMLIRELSGEIARRYDYVADGSGLFQPEDVLVERAAFVVGYTEGHAVACGALRPLEGDIAEIKRMYVQPRYRGKGYARAILAELERLAGEYGYSSIRLETGHRQLEAIGLYERSGYRRIPLFGVYVVSAWRELSVCFEKQIPEPEL